MCGIAGIIQLPSAGYTREQLEKMTLALAHRGPDGEGHYSNADHTALLGHRRLSIIDRTETGQQPMNYRGRYSIIHNGEIYNYKELKAELEQKGYAFRSQTDTEVIAAAMIAGKKNVSPASMGCLLLLSGMNKKENSLPPVTGLERSHSFSFTISIASFLRLK